MDERNQNTSTEETRVVKLSKYIRNWVTSTNTSFTESLREHLCEFTKSELDQLLTHLTQTHWYTFDVLKMIIEAGGDPRVENDVLLRNVIGHDDYFRLIKYFLELGLDPNKHDAFLNVCYVRDTECIKLMLDYGAKITDNIIKETTRFYKMDAIKVFIEYGVKLEDFYKNYLTMEPSGRKQKAKFLKLIATDEIDHVAMLKECADILSRDQ